MSDQEKWVVGATVQLETVTGEQLKGQIYAYDEWTHTLVLRQPNSNTKSTFPFAFDMRMVRADSITQASYVRAPAADAEEKISPSNVNVQVLRKKEHRAVEEAKRAVVQVGVGVSENAQKLFDAICRTMPAVWQKQDILVLDAVLITPPYRADDCRLVGSVADPDRMLQRIKTVVEGESKKLNAN
eukprot:m.68136 g.68136  ORF g.68136 m.68136 type:complete len:185 (-) comp16679_c0_seq1:1244-1798(-)